MPTIYIIAGSNGSGKKTFAKESFPLYKELMEVKDGKVIKVPASQLCKI